MDYIFEGFKQAIYLLVSGNEDTYSALFVTIQVSSLSIIISLLLGLPMGFITGYLEFPGRRQFRMVVDTLLAMPTVVVGLFVYAFITKKGPLGELGILFAKPGIVIAQVILILPIVISHTATAIEGLDKRLYMTLITLGAKHKQVILTSLWEARFAVSVAAFTAYGRAVSEVGVSMMIGGNIKGHTRTLTTAIALESGKGDFAMGIALGIVLLLIAFFVNFVMVFLKKISNE